MRLSEILIIAGQHVMEGVMSSSAQLCLSDAVTLRDRGDLDGAKRRALHSLAYSVGILHPDFKRAAA